MDKAVIVKYAPKKIILAADFLYCNKIPVDELIIAQALSENPALDIEFTSHSKTSLNQKLFIDLIPRSIISLSPDWIFLGLGNWEVLNNVTLDEYKKNLTEILNLIKTKTPAQIFMAGLCPILYPKEKERDCQMMNSVLVEQLCLVDGIYVDVAAFYNDFTKQHKLSRGSQLPLYSQGPVLSTLGALLMAQKVWQSINPRERRAGKTVSA